MILDDLRVPIVLAPLAGGPATVDLALAVSDAGGLGFLAAGYRTADDVREQVAAFRARSDGPFGVNVFARPERAAAAGVVAAYAAELAPEARRAGVALGAPRSDDDAYDAKLAVVRELAPAVVSFVFGCPTPDEVRALRDAGAEVWVTVTNAAEARAAQDGGADVLVVQGAEAGGHRGGFADGEHEPYGLIALLQLVGAEARVPLVAAGGITTGRGVAGVLAAGARAAQLGTAFLRTPEAGTAQVHRDALATDAPTALTRAFSGKPARAIVNRFLREHDATAPPAYPEVHHVTAPLRQAGRASGDPDLVNLWAGQAHVLAGDAPAGEVVRRLAHEARAALREAAERFER